MATGWGNDGRVLKEGNEWMELESRSKAFSSALLLSNPQLASGSAAAEAIAEHAHDSIEAMLLAQAHTLGQHGVAWGEWARLRWMEGHRFPPRLLHAWDREAIII